MHLCFLPPGDALAMPDSPDQAEKRDCSTNLIPPPLPSLDVPPSPPWRHMQHDIDMDRKVSEAADNGEVLRYVAVMDGTTSKCRVELRNYLNSHPFAQLQVRQGWKRSPARFCSP